MGGPLARTDVLLLAPLLALIVPAPAAADPLPETADVVGLHLAAGGLAWEAPSSSQSLRRSITFPGATPALTFVVPLGHLRLAQPLDIVGDGVFTVWVTADQAAVLSQLRVEVYRNAGLVASGSTNQRLDPDDPDAMRVAPDAPRRLAIGVALRGLHVEAQDVLELAVSAFGAAVNGHDDVDVLALLGSVRHPSALTFPVQTAGALPVLGRLSSLYLAEDALTPSAPSSEGVDEHRSTPGVAEQEWVWARYLVDRGFTLVADTPATLWLKTGPGATAAHGRGVRVLLYVDDRAVSQNTGMLDASAAKTSAPDSQVVVGLPTKGLVVPARSELRLAFSFLAPPDPSLTSVQVVYGGPERPSGLAFAVQEHGPEPAPLQAPALSPPEGAVSSPEPTATPPVVASSAAFMAGQPADAAPAVGPLGALAVLGLATARIVRRRR